MPHADSGKAPTGYVPLLQVATDPRLLGASLSWRARQLDMLRLFGDEEHRLVVVAAGRQGGKSTAAVTTAIWAATMRPDLDELLPKGRVRFVLLAAPSEAQSRELISVARGMIEASPVLHSLADVKADRIDFTLRSGARTAIRALPARPQSVRGMTASHVIADEAAHFDSADAGVNNDARMIEALEGSMSVFDAHGKSKLILISTPAGELGRFYELFRDAEAGALPDAVAMHAPAWELNPALDNEEWKESKRRLLGADRFSQEHGAAFISGAGQFFDLRDVTFTDGPAMPAQGAEWVAGLDPAFHGDRLGVTLVGKSTTDAGVLLVGRVEALEPGEKLRSFDARRGREDAMLARVWEIIEPYHPRIVTDQHQADAVASYFGRLGCPVRVQHLTGPLQTAAFVSMRTRLLDGSLRCWRHPLLLEELRRVRARDTESIDLPRFGGGHCDAASALALAVWEFRGFTGSPAGQARAGGNPISAGLLGGEPGSEPAPYRRLGDPDAPRRASLSRPAGWGRRSSLAHREF